MATKKSKKKQAMRKTKARAKARAKRARKAVARPKKVIVPLTAREWINTAIARMGMSKQAFGRWLGMHERTPRFWSEGRYKLPHHVLLLMLAVQGMSSEEREALSRRAIKIEEGWKNGTG